MKYAHHNDIIIKGARFTGKEYYNPETGRYLVPQNVDNLGFETDGLNLFAYCHNRPLNVNEIKTATTSSTYNYTNSTDLDISQALLIGAGAIGNVLDIASTAVDFLEILKKTKSLNIYSNILTGLSIGIEFIRTIIETGDLLYSINYIAPNILTSLAGTFLGMTIATAIGGLPGAIFGTILSILFEDLFKQLFGI